MGSRFKREVRKQSATPSPEENQDVSKVSYLDSETLAPHFYPAKSEDSDDFNQRVTSDKKPSPSTRPPLQPLPRFQKENLRIEVE